MILLLFYFLKYYFFFSCDHLLFHYYFFITLILYYFQIYFNIFSYLQIFQSLCTINCRSRLRHLHYTPQCASCRRLLLHRKRNFLCNKKTATIIGGSNKHSSILLTSSHQQSQSVYPAVQNNYIPNLPSAVDTWKYL